MFWGMYKKKSIFSQGIRRVDDGSPIIKILGRRSVVHLSSHRSYRGKENSFEIDENCWKVW